MAKLIRIILLLVINFQSFGLEIKNSTDRFKLALGKFKTISSNFTQNTYDQHGNIIEHSIGHLLLKKPNNFYWEVFRPNEQIIVKNKIKLWIYDKDLDQVTVQNITSLKQFNVLNLLIDENFDYDNHFKVLLTKISNKEIFTLETVNDNFDFNKLIIIFTNNKLSELE
ncbi:MAG: outer membrane lipoprotein chaperone LolA, partial [Legionellales bacterium]|nr:outer membrane lipoprotein chaperone LolA [Legionellales bacterium]